MNEYVLAKVMGFEGEPLKLCEALISAGFLDGDENSVSRIHNWDEHMGRLSSRRAANKVRMRPHGHLSVILFIPTESEIFSPRPLRYGVSHRVLSQ